jgi:dTDP-4-dehydrorhamnose reductase
VLITGSEGQLGKLLQSKFKGAELALADLPDVDVTNREQFFAIANSFLPDVVFHCAAYTDVDGCVDNPELAYRVNSTGTQNVALACLEIGATMVHISSNEVFAGDNFDGYEEWMPLNPINIYGRTKAASEHHVRSILNRYFIVRTAWLYASGGRNFIHAIMRQARGSSELKVVTDEVGNPTNASDLAKGLVKLIESGQYGTYHLVNQGACSRYEFAREILNLAGLSDVELVPILHSEFDRASSPPPYGALKNINGSAIGLTMRSWKAALADFMATVVPSKPKSIA